MVLWIAVLMNLISTINCLNYSANSTSSKSVSAAIIGDFKIGFLVSVRLHNPQRQKSNKFLECGKVSFLDVNQTL